MATNGILQLEKSYAQVGLGTLTFTVPLTVSAFLTPVVNIPFSVLCQVTVPQAHRTGAGAGSGADQGLGMTGGFPGAPQALQTLSNGQTGLGQSFPNVPANSAPGINPTTMPETTPNLPLVTLGNGVSGLGFGGSENDDASGNGSGHGAGAGGGDVTGFARGGNGLGDGGVGQGFGPVANNYPQPPLDVHIPTSGPAVSSGLSIVVKQNGSTIYTAPALGTSQSSLQFKTTFLCNASDSITVVFASSTASDEQLQGISANVSIEQGQ